MCRSTLRYWLWYSKDKMYRGHQQGFALPTVVITGTVLFAVMTIILGTTASTRTVLDAQFYQALARDAAESGAAHAKACLGDPTFLAGVISITPQTNCAGVNQPSSSAYVTNVTAGSQKYRTSYSAKVISSNPDGKSVTITSGVELLRTSTNSTWKTYAGRVNLQTSLKPDPVGDRASQRLWYFGKNAGLDFGVSGTALPTAVQSPGGPVMKEGSTVVTDQNGNLQFYSDGLNIWNKNGVPMTGSTSPNLIGANSATQAVAAFPLDATRTRYGVVSNSGQGETGLGELYLHIVDMSQNGGLGAVVSKNAMLGVGKALGTANSYNGNNVDKSYTGEALGAMPKADGTGYFVYSYASALNKVVGFLINTNGTVSPTPITWTMNPAPLQCAIPWGQDLTASGGVNATANTGTYGYGSVSFTKDYTKMLLFAGAHSCYGSDSGQVYYFDVNGITGALTLKNSWTTSSPYTMGGSISNGGYNAEFSPAEKYVYVTQIYPTYVQRFSLASPTTNTSISSSAWYIGPGSANMTEGGGYIKRGPDGRMYISDRGAHYRYTYAGFTPPPQCRLGYINNPDATTNTRAAIGWNVASTGTPIILGTAATGPCAIWGLPQTATVYTSQVVVY